MRSPRHRHRRPQHEQLPILGFSLIAVMLAAFFMLAKGHTDANSPATPGSSTTGAANGAAPSNWHQALGISGKIVQVAFAEQNPLIGYASVFLDKNRMAVYASRDEGTTWKQIATLSTPFLDLLEINPTDAQDVALLPSYVPAPGGYHLQRSLNGGATWHPVATTLPYAASVSNIGWANASLLTSFSLDGSPVGGSSVVRFDRNADGKHLDTNGKFGGVSIDVVQYLHGEGAKITILGVSATAQQADLDIRGAQTTDNGATWSNNFTFSQGGQPIVPLATTQNGRVILSLNSNRHTLYLSQDGGNSWALQHDNGAAPYDLAAARPLIENNGTYLVKLTQDDAPGKYSVQNDSKSHYTDSLDVIAFSYGPGGKLHRLWAYDEGNLVWRVA